MALRTVSGWINKKKQPSLVLTLSATALLIGAGSAAYWFFTHTQPSARNLPVGVNIIPQDALFTISLTTDTQEWSKLKQLAKTATKSEVEKNLLQLKNRFLKNNGYDFDQDIKPWVGDEVTIAVLPGNVFNAESKPLENNQTVPQTIPQQSMMMVLPIKKSEFADKLLTQPQLLKQGKWVESNYQGITIKQTETKTGEKLAAAVINQQFLVITDDIKTTEKTIDSYQNQTSLSQLTSFAENVSKINADKPFAQFYINIPTAAKIAAQTPNNALPAQVLTQLKSNQGLAGKLILEPKGMRLKGVSWLNPNSQRLLAVENKAVNMQNLLPSETLMMFSGSNLSRFWYDYNSTAKGNNLAPVKPEELRKNVKSLLNLDLEKDLLNWMSGEFSVAIIPNSPKDATPDNFRAGLVFMVKTGNSESEKRKSAENTLAKLNDVVKNQYQFQVQPANINGQDVVNWISPFGTLTATYGWLNDDVLFFVFGAPVTDKI
ncbi:MAG: DUF3352 domain-containing protein, partial [Nostocales cyanobacterium]